MIDAANYVILLARKLKHSDYVLDDTTLNDLAFKTDPDIATVEDVLDRTRTTLKKLYEGKHTAGACNTPHVDKAIKALNEELKAIAKSKKQAQQEEEAYEVGQEIIAEADKQDKADGAASVSV